ncbi:MAG: ABC-type transporter, periplasmic subunit family 3, partial [Firmicutes bacterium]|nr:ABC-type transporter, periplasmic subunit family 3 [Bacillota bacterium]
ATRGTFKPFTYMDDKDHLTGYDIEILREIEKRNPSIKFEFKTMSVDAGFLAMESGQIDLIANQIVSNPQRADKSIFTKEVNNYTSRKLAVKGDRNDIQGIDDLRGKKVAVTSSSEVTRQLQKYNETAEPKIDLVYTDKGTAETFNLVATGRVDATPAYDVAIEEAKKTLGINIKAVGPTIASDATSYALRKDEKSQQLADLIDATIKEMRADGTLKKLSEQFLGKDYTIPQK